MPPHQFATPLLISRLDGTGTVRGLSRLGLGGSTIDGRCYDERWIQHLIHDHPELLPIDELEQALTPLVPVCIELPTPGGFLDNLFVTPTGGLVLAECKLWRNPEARRQVVAQAIDYARCLVGWGYEDLEGAIAAALLPDGSKPGRKLWDMVSPNPELDEPHFIDAVSRNLRLGRALVLIVGDGIREEMESLTDYLQVHAGLHFTLALVEMAVHQLPEGLGFLVQPRVLARTVNIDRGIVRLDAKGLSIAAPQRPIDGPRTRRTTLSDEVFYERLAELDPNLPDRLRSFVTRLEPLGVVGQMKASLNLRWSATDESEFNLGYVMTNGETWTDAVNWTARQLGLLELSHEYVQRLAEAIGGDTRRHRTGNWWVVKNGKASKIGDLLAHEQEWYDAIESFTTRVNEALRDRER
jgi:hypothetical protein